MSIDNKKLLLKYICHVAASEGINFAANSNLSPCGMHDMEFTKEEIDFLENHIFPLAKEWDGKDMFIKSAEQKARDLLERMEVPNAQDYTAGELVELANLFAE